MMCWEARLSLLAPPGIKITPKAFGRDRRLPITNQYHDW